MLRKSTTFVPALAFGLLLSTVPAAAAPPAGDFFGSVRGAFVSLWQRLGGVWGEVGSEISPLGQPSQSPTAVWGEIGGEISPWGQPAQSPAPPPGEVGVMIDPAG